MMGIVSRKAKSQRWKRLVAERLREELVTRNKAAFFWVSYALLMAALACFILAAARPYKGETKSFGKIESRNIMLMVDVSKSMLCEDVASNRLTAAKSLALQLLNTFPNDRIGVLAFAGSNHVIVPLTIDHAAVHDTISQLDTQSVALEGSNLPDAAQNGIEALKATGQRANALVILSDGTESDEGMEKVIKEAKNAGVQIFTVGVGTPSGGVIPSDEDPTGKHRDTEGRVVHTKLEARVLRQLAESTSGIYTSINSNPDKTISNALDSMERYEQEGREQVIPNELYVWFLAPGVLLLLASIACNAKWKMPKLSAPALTALLLTLPHFSQGAEWWDKTKEKYFEQPSREQQGYKDLQKQEYKQALENLERARSLSSGEKRAELSLAVGETQFRLNKYSDAASAYGDALLSERPEIQQKANYNMGNSLYEQQWSELKIPSDMTLEDYLVKAVQSADPKKIPPMKIEKLDTLEKGFTNAKSKYEAALDLQPTDEAAEKNRKLSEENIAAIRRARERLKQQQQQQQQQGDAEQDPKDQQDGEGKGDENEPKEGGDKNQPNQNPQDGEGDEQQPNKPDENGDQEKPGDKEDGKEEQADQLGGDLDPTLTKEERARELLEQHADMQKRPVGNAMRTWRRKPKIDW